MYFWFLVRGKKKEKENPQSVQEHSTLPAIFQPTLIYATSTSTYIT
jgi:hypothetical protein